MPRRNTGPRLVFYKPLGYSKPLYFIRWYERGAKRERATGTDDRATAEAALKAFLEQIAQPLRAVHSRHASQITLAEVLTHYGEEHAPQAIAGERIGYAISALIPFWGELTTDIVRGETCRAYYKARRSELAERFPRRAEKSLPSPVDGKGPACFDGTIRRELGALKAAILYCAKEGYLTSAPEVWLPKKRPSKKGWLTRSQVAKLLRKARIDGRGRKHLPLFILIGIYMGQRKNAILSLQWLPNFSGGWVDLDNGVIHWDAEMAVESNKKRPTSPIPRRLMRFLRYQRTKTAQYVFERAIEQEDGKITYEPIGDIKHGFATAACLAGMGTLEKIKRKRKQRNGLEVYENIGRADITPHILRHSCITWLLQRGVDIREVAGFVGASAQTVEDVYGHHHPAYLQKARTALD